jgi:septum formation protein
MKQLILASASPRRKRLLEQLGIVIKVVPSEIDEKLNPRLKPKSQAELLSLEKAQAVAKNYKDAVVLAADTLVFIDDEILGKPTNEDDAKRMLKKLSGKSHRVITGFTLIHTAAKKIITESVETVVTFRKLSEKEIKSYIKKEHTLDKAGAYAAQGVGSLLIEKIDGDFFNVVGLPISKVFPLLKKFGIEVL